MQASTITLAFCLAVLPAAAQQIDDPANLMGERVSAPALADTLPINHGAPALEQLLRKLRTRASMMLIVAHPDDEDGGLLTYESRGMGARVAMLSLTRGEGGQNLMSADFNDALGLIRTQELLAEDRYTGTDQFFGSVVDFGFSKTKEETFKQWGHDRVLYDAVRAVRLYRPMVLASVFLGGPTDGHGQHQVSGEMTQEVFVAAADPKIFPEMGLPAWAPLRVYARVPFSRVGPEGMYDYATGRMVPSLFHNYVTGVTTRTAPVATVTIHEGDKPKIAAFNHLSYVQWARQGLALQKSQIGPDMRIPPAGVADVGYTLMGSRTPCTAPSPGIPCPKAQPLPSANSRGAEDLFSGIDTSLPTLADLAPALQLHAALEAIDHMLAEAQRIYTPAQVALTAPSLRDALKALDSLLSEVQTASLDRIQKFNLLHELRVKHVQCNDALVLALELSTRSEVKSGRVLVIPPFTSSSVTVNLRESFDNPTEQKLALLDVPHPESMSPSSLNSVHPIGRKMDMNLSRTVHFASGEVKAGTQPYFARPSLAQPFYDIKRPSLRDAPSTPSFMEEASRFRFDGVPITIASVAEASGAPLVTVPALSVSLAPSVGILNNTHGTLQLKVIISTESSSPFSGTLRLSLPPRWRSEPEQIAFKISHESGDQEVQFAVTPVATDAGARYTVTAVASVGAQQYREGYRAVGYPGLTSTNFYAPASFKVTAVDVNTAPSLKVAYLPGTGDEVPQFLPSLGVKPTIITTKNLNDLTGFDVVVLGVRAYSAHPDLSGAGSRSLLEYAKQGGVVIVQYNSGGFDSSSAPFPYTLMGDPAHNVVDEDQPVTLLQPENPLLIWPNRMTAHDFDHWVEERGHGFASAWSPEYTALVETHDIEQDPQKGGLLLARVGKGAYIYCALALYRQLPEGVPGAYRLMANLLSYAKNPQR